MIISIKISSPELNFKFKLFFVSKYLETATVPNPKATDIDVPNKPYVLVRIIEETIATNAPINVVTKILFVFPQLK